MLQIQVFGATPPCANCKRAEAQAQKAADHFPGRVQVIKRDAFDPEAEAYGLIVPPLVVVGDQIAGAGQVVPAEKLIPIIQAALGD